MLERILPGCVATAEATADDADVRLFPEEEELVARSVASRRQEFTTTRHCARVALTRLGIAPGPILREARGMPLWPAGVVGSMTHCAGYRAAAVAYETDIASVGIDAEPNAPLPAGVATRVASTVELEGTAALSVAQPAVHWDRVLFSAKESVYKAWYPLTRRWLDFSEVTVTMQAGASFVAHLTVPGPTVDGDPLTCFHGRFSVDAGVILTAVVVARRAPGAVIPAVVIRSSG